MTAPSLSDASVQGYLAVLQGVITRMASNSANCKTWCVTAVSGLLILAADKRRPELMVTLAVPIVLFALLDAYYLGLERLFRQGCCNFVKRVHEGSATVTEVFVIQPPGTRGEVVRATFGSFLSFAVGPFYLLMAGMVAVAWRILA